MTIAGVPQVRARDEFGVDRVRKPMVSTLAAFNDAEVLIAADVHVARQLGRLAGESDPDVLLATALAVRAVRQGSVCLDLHTVREAVIGENLDIAPASDDADPVGRHGPLGSDGLPARDPELARQLALQAELDWPDPEHWQRVVVASPMVEVCADDAVPPTDGGPGRPLRWFAGRLYLDRYWRQERAVAAELVARASLPDDALDEQNIARRTAAIGRLFPEPENERRQRIGAAVSVSRRLAVLAGGPGTGKTTAVARMIAVLADREGPAPRIALAAPTGKAAARLGQAVRDEIATFSGDDRARIADLQASTLHRLLGWRPGSRSRFRHDARHHLPHDLVVVDESSMVPLTMMARLLEALRPEARLLLVGDPDQLASVEAGAVLGDIVARAETVGNAAATDDLLVRLCPADESTLDPVDRRAAAAGVTRLTHRFRFGQEIGSLADAIRSGDADAALSVLGAGGSKIDWVDREADESDSGMAELRDDVVRAARTLTTAALDGDVRKALEAMDEHRLLCAHRSGPFGAAWWARVTQRWIAADRAVRGELSAVPDRRTGADSWWEPGRPLLITDNDYELGLFNGDTGVVIRDAAHGLSAVFGDARDPVTVRPGRLSGVQSVYAMTIHKSQGSQFRAVTVILPPAQSPLLTRELLYTAATRASERVRIIGSAHAVRTAIARPVSRASGLRG